MSYILVHQARLAYPAVAEDDNLGRYVRRNADRQGRKSTLRRTFFLEAIVAKGVYVWKGRARREERGGELRRSDRRGP